MRGSSPSMGAVTLPSTSRRPLMVVLLTSSKYITAVGSASPATRPMSMMTEPLGLMGALLPVGDFITWVLSALKARASSFSSRFCSRKR